MSGFIQAPSFPTSGACSNAVEGNSTTYPQLTFGMEEAVHCERESTPPARTNGGPAPASSTATPKRIRKSPSKSPSKSPTKPAPTDPSKWRRSSVPGGQEITRGNAKKLYRLSDSDLKPLRFETRTTAADYRMYLYQETEVERAAWKKHGSPEGFEAYISKLKVTYLKNPKNTPSNFPEPKLIPDVQAPQVYFVQKGVAYNSTQDASYQTKLNNLSARFPAPWIFNACLKYLRQMEEEGCMLGRSDQLEILGKAIRNGRLSVLDDYPARPKHPLPTSRSVTALRELLGRAPRIIEGEESFGIDVIDDGFSGDTNYYWAREYKEEVYGALLAVIAEHGFGDAGWRGARWEVYDKFSVCIEGIKYYSDGHDKWWVDEAWIWLSSKGSEVMSGPPRYELGEEKRKIYDDALRGHFGNTCDSFEALNSEAGSIALTNNLDQNPFYLKKVGRSRESENTDVSSVSCTSSRVRTSKKNLASTAHRNPRVGMVCDTNKRGRQTTPAREIERDAFPTTPEPSEVPFQQISSPSTPSSKRSKISCKADSHISCRIHMFHNASAKRLQFRIHWWTFVTRQGFKWVELWQWLQEERLRGRMINNVGR
ncbi:hypothetical protein P7C70_g4774, partial [Phenoliferia sp. Uapishka_3]